MPDRNESVVPESVASGLDVPEDVQRATRGSSHAAGCLLAAIFVLFPAVVYFGFFGLLVLDELVLGTRYLGQDNLPPQVIDWIVIIYWPLIVLTRWMLGMQ